MRKNFILHTSYFLLLAALPGLAQAQTHGPLPSHAPARTAPEASAQSDNEIDVTLYNRGIGSTDVSAMLIGQNIYLQPLDVFDFAHIKADVSADGTTLTGFYIDPARKYTFDNTNRECTYQEHIFHLTPEEYITASDGAYLRADEFEKIFNLKCIFDFRGLSVELKSPEPLPAESEQKYAANRKKDLTSLGGQDEKPDEVFDLQRSWFSLGTIDYSGSYSYTTGQLPMQTPADYEFYGGGQLLGGDMDVMLQGQSRQRVDWHDMPWQWRYSVQSSDLVRQILIGRQDALFTTMQLPASMIGFQISNISTAYKTSFTNYTLADHTEPDWTVELYVNDALVNYTKADQTGYYKFVIPLSYGATNIKLKFYGPYGEVRTKVVDLQIPYTFLPPGHLDYTLTGGTSIATPGLANSMGQLDMKLGVSTAMTVGGGVRYLAFPGLTGTSGIAFRGATYTPYGTASIRVTGDMLLGGEYYDGSGYKGTLSFTGPAGLSLEAEYDQPLGTSNASSILGTSTVTNPTYITDQRKLTLSSPLPFELGSLRLAATDLPMNALDGNLTLSPEVLLDVFGTSLNFSASGNFLRNRFVLHPMGDITGEGGISLMLFSGLVLRPDFQIDYTTRKVASVNLGFTRSFGDWGNFSLTGTHSFGMGGSTSAQLSFRTMLPGVQVGISSGSGSAQPVTSSATVQGSLGFDANTGFFGSNRPEVRRGGIEVIPFIDKNGDGKWDAGEPLVPNFGFERAPGRVISSDSGILRIVDLEPYNSYFVKTSTANLDNISLLPKFSSFEVTPPANGFARIEIPLASAGQLEGYVMEIKAGKLQGLGGARLIVRHWEPGVDTTELSFSQDLLSYSNGEYYYMGIMPGTYRICIDPKQLAILHATSKPGYLEFTVHSKEDGDVLEGLNFKIEHQPMSTHEQSQLLK